MEGKRIPFFETLASAVILTVTMQGASAHGAGTNWSKIAKGAAIVGGIAVTADDIHQRNENRRLRQQLDNAHDESNAPAGDTTSNSDTATTSSDTDRINEKNRLREEARQKLAEEREKRKAFLKLQKNYLEQLNVVSGQGNVTNQPHLYGWTYDDASSYGAYRMLTNGHFSLAGESCDPARFSFSIEKAFGGITKFYASAPKMSELTPLFILGFSVPRAPKWGDTELEYSESRLAKLKEKYDSVLSNPGLNTAPLHQTLAEVQLKKQQLEHLKKRLDETVKAISAYTNQLNRVFRHDKPEEVLKARKEEMENTSDCATAWNLMQKWYVTPYKAHPEAYNKAVEYSHAVLTVEFHEKCGSQDESVYNTDYHWINRVEAEAKPLWDKLNADTPQEAEARRKLKILEESGITASLEDYQIAQNCVNGLIKDVYGKYENSLNQKIADTRDLVRDVHAQPSGVSQTATATRRRSAR